MPSHPKHLCSATETDSQAHTITSDPEAHGADRRPSPAGPAESPKPTLGWSKEDSSGGPVRLQIHTAQGNHQAAEEAAEGAAPANYAADGEAEYQRLGGGHGADGSAGADLAAGRLQTRDWQRGACRGGVGSLEVGPMRGKWAEHT